MAAPIFVVRKHAARPLHWDFRLEHAGVLWSWAVLNGPSLDPQQKRLAVRVDDQPLDSADVGPTDPQGGHGAGSVELWDHGTWEAQVDPAQGLADGELKFVLHGERLHGGFVLLRLKPRGKPRVENWLLMKQHDDQQRAGTDATAPGHLPARATRRRRQGTSVAGGFAGPLPTTIGKPVMRKRMGS